MGLSSRRSPLSVAVLVLVMAGLSGCSGSYPWGKSKKELPAVTWQEEKAKTQAMMREIAAQVPEGVSINAEVKEAGTLFGCNQTGPNREKLHSWTGSATVTVTPGSNIESIVRGVESHYREVQYSVEIDRSVLGNYRIQMKPPGEKSSYIVTKGDSDQIRIAGWSECFLLPEGLYPGGSFSLALER